MRIKITQRQNHCHNFNICVPIVCYLASSKLEKKPVPNDKAASIILSYFFIFSNYSDLETQGNTLCLLVLLLEMSKCISLSELTIALNTTGICSFNVDVVLINLIMAASLYLTL